MIEADTFIPHVRDGRATYGCLEALRGFDSHADIATVTVGGNDLLELFYARNRQPSLGQQNVSDVLDQIELVYDLIALKAETVIVNTVYDPSDGDLSRAAEIGVPKTAHSSLLSMNSTIRRLASERGFLLCDLELLFKGHGFWSSEPWIVQHMKPNLEGATQIAKAWHQLAKNSGVDRLIYTAFDN